MVTDTRIHTHKTTLLCSMGQWKDSFMATLVYQHSTSVSKLLAAYIYIYIYIYVCVCVCVCVSVCVVCIVDVEIKFYSIEKRLIKVIIIYLILNVSFIFCPDFKYISWMYNDFWTNLLVIIIIIVIILMTVIYLSQRAVSVQMIQSWLFE